ncbi:MAG: molecular chaperone TorD family protein [Syntrophomonadaceae bacterium]|nr:molecular chaperone TorD family protein [Syntrophomonadaceae bacterium]
MVNKMSFRLYSYSFLAKALDYPTAESVKELFNPELIEAIFSYKDALKKEEPPASRLRTALDDFRSRMLEAVDLYSSQESYLLELQKEYTRLCHASKPRLLPLFESVYREGKLLQQSTVDVARLYYQAGLQLAEGFSLPPDHISLELEFMAYLCSQEIEAAENNDSFVLDKAKEMQQKMLTEHLRHFVPAFAERIQKHATLGFYQAAGNFLEHFIDWELRSL